MRKGKRIKGSGITMPEGKALRDLGERPYKYLKVLKADQIKMRDRTKKGQKGTLLKNKTVFESTLKEGI